MTAQLPLMLIEKYLWHAFLPNSDGATFHGNWHHNDVCHQWEGNPVLLAEVDDIIASIRHKVNSEGAEQKHSGAMKKEYMDKILAWSGSLCPLNAPLQYIHLVMVGCKMLPSGESLSRKVRLAVTWHLKHLAFGAVVFMLWTRNYELLKLKHGDVKLDWTVIDGMFMKYLQGKEVSLTINECNAYFKIHLKNCNHYKIYPHPDMGKHKWHATASITSCLHQWGSDGPLHGSSGGGDGLKHDTLMHYLLDELNCYKNNHSDALQLVPHEGDHSLTGKAALVQPVSTKALNMVHALITSDMAVLHTTMKEVKETLCSLSVDAREIHQQLSNMSNLVVKALTLASACSAPSGPVLHQDTTGSNAWVMPIAAAWISLPTFTCADHNIVTPSDPVHFHSNSRMPQVVQPLDLSLSTSLPSQVGPQGTKACASTSLLGVVILEVPVLHPNGTQTAKSDSWRDIVCHWTEGEPQLDLHIPLKDWPYHYYNGKSSCQFNTKYSQQCIIVMEFLNEFQGDEETFLKIYGSAISQGHMKLLKAILAAHKWYCGAGECCCCLTSEEVCNNFSLVLQGTTGSKHGARHPNNSTQQHANPASHGTKVAEAHDIMDSQPLRSCGNYIPYIPGVLEILTVPSQLEGSSTAQDPKIMREGARHRLVDEKWVLGMPQYES
ncbi:hypothetical protein F5J12DRAFT_928371 [Pisolithus orientalis]|uniref:uncharacterized protein n=1 Tax=Pisolithus orientalis TaxID=936130 RepID=UPI00222494E7|nr:uncharacterized protein F5J12DRAFT_928371 [Pisolithus orientalis]KAI6001641.1 hypothetical protein F5J12DRAFT_928371 [Pisolithus orientalis]